MEHDAASDVGKARSGTLLMSCRNQRGSADNAGSTNHIAPDGMGRIPPIFCAATETARDVAMEYTNMPVGSILQHKFEKYTVGGESYVELEDDGDDDKNPFDQ
jgi:hypothetical protein